MANYRDYQRGNLYGPIHEGVVSHMEFSYLLYDNVGLHIYMYPLIKTWLPYNFINIHINAAQVLSEIRGNTKPICLSCVLVVLSLACLSLLPVMSMVVSFTHCVDTLGCHMNKMRRKALIKQRNKRIKTIFLAERFISHYKQFLT